MVSRLADPGDPNAAGFQQQAGYGAGFQQQAVNAAGSQQQAGNAAGFQQQPVNAPPFQQLQDAVGVINPDGILDEGVMRFFPEINIADFRDLSDTVRTLPGNALG